MEERMHIVATMARHFPEIISYVFLLFIVSPVAVVAEDDKKSHVGRGWEINWNLGVVHYHA